MSARKSSRPSLASSDLLTESTSETNLDLWYRPWKHCCVRVLGLYIEFAALGQFLYGYIACTPFDGRIRGVGYFVDQSFVDRASLDKFIAEGHNTYLGSGTVDVQVWR
jgi:hypothetical protein